MRNLKEETLSELESHGKTKEDIRWIGCNKFKIPINLFWKLADKEYDSGYGGVEVAPDLLIVGDNWWLERHEYDGSEWWEYKEKPKEPKLTIIPETIFPKEDTNYRVFYLYEFL